VTKRIYGHKRTKKSEPASSNVDAQAQDDLAADQPQNAPSVPDAAQPLPSKRDRKRRAREQAQDQISCQMGKFHRLWRALGFVLMLGLNIGIVGGDLMGGAAYVRLSWQREAISLLLLVFFNALVLFPIVFEAWFVKADKDKIELKTMFWRTSKRWDEVTDFKNPVYLKLAMLRTGRGFYLLNKRVLPEYPILEALILRYWRVPRTKV
jgi:hypothetical protein